MVWNGWVIEGNMEHLAYNSRPIRSQSFKSGYCCISLVTLSIYPQRTHTSQRQAQIWIVLKYINRSSNEPTGTKNAYVTQHQLTMVRLYSTLTSAGVL